MPTVRITQQQAVETSNRLENLGTRLELAGDPDWYIAAVAAALLESLRLGLTTIEPPVWIGIDLAVPGTDKTVWSPCHA